MPPKHHHPPHLMPPHLRKPKHGSMFGVILISFLVSSVFTIIVASIMAYFKISWNVIIPSMAPIWIGIATISYMAQTQR